jgi:hypothetical protein
MNRMLAQLNRRLRRRGEDIVMQRQIGAVVTSSVQARVPAIVKALTVEQLIGNITTMSYFIILSPSHLIDDAQWPGGKAPAAVTNSIIAPSDQRLPNTNDKVYVRGAQKAIQRVAPVFDAGACVRIELTVQG